MKERKKRLLFITPDHYSFYRVVEDAFRAYSEYKVHTIISNGNYVYKNKLEKFKNFFYKKFLNKNIKVINAKKNIINQINRYKNYDIFFAIRADILNEETLNIANSKSKKSIVNFWDSFEKIKGQKETMPFFQKCYSFDKFDCVKYNLLKSTNFYFNTEKFENPEYDVFFLGTFDKRFNTLVNILEILNKNSIKANATLFSYEKSDAKENPHQYINYIHNIVPFPDAIEFHKNTGIILDVQHNNQVGLSFRPFDAIGMKKKLITTNIHIKEYDFYNENNIFIWRNDTLNIPKSFFETPYEDIPTNIYEKYNLNNWVKNILS